MTHAPVVVGLDEQDAEPIDLDTWVDLARTVLTAEGVTGPAELNLTFVDRDEITALNHDHLGGDGPTDVLSFPLDDDPSAVPADQPRLLGDVIICPEIVAGQAPGDTDDELALMVVHGVLHILGMDHAEATDAAAMRAAEQRHLASWRRRP